MKNNVDLHNNLNAVFELIEQSINDDNIITKDEFQKIQNIKEQLNVTNKSIRDFKKTEIDRILYLQLYLLLLDNDIDLHERQELEYYKKIFGYSEKEMLQIELKVKKDKHKDKMW